MPLGAKAKEKYKALCQKALDTWVLCGENRSEAARKLGWAVPTTQHRVESAFTLGLKPTVTAPVEAAKEARKTRDMVAELRASLAVVTKELNRRDDVKNYLFGVKDAAPPPPKWTVRTKVPTKGPGTPILLFSDAQWGETIRAGELAGVNEFNTKVAAERYQKLIERTIDLCKSHMVNPVYDGIIYLRGGDMVSGDIHDELRETNEMNAGPAAADLVRCETAGIRALAEAFGKVHVISVPGNHGRTTKKPHAKRFVEENWDTVTAWWLQSNFAEDKRVTFNTPASGDAVFKVYGWTYLLTHGDRIGSRGGQGFIGPAATIARGMKKTYDYYASIGVKIDEMFVGHFHTALRLEYGFANGSLPGYSEYAKSEMRARVSRPMQWLVFVHPKYGVTCQWPVYLDDQRVYSDSIAELGGVRS